MLKFRFTAHRQASEKRHVQPNGRLLKMRWSFSGKSQLHVEGPSGGGIW